MSGLSVISPVPARLDPVSAGPLLANLGFLASPDLPDRPGPAYLLVALRGVPTLRHFDPEVIEYWVSRGGRGVRRTLTRATALPIDTEFSWGLIRVVDRLHVTNEYLTFGGRVAARSVGEAVVAVFTSEAPLLRRGGHSQTWDQGADSLGAFFSRFLLAVDYAPGFEAKAGAADPVTRYAAFLADAMRRYRSSPIVRFDRPDLWMLLQTEARRLRESHPRNWEAGEALWREACP